MAVLSLDIGTTKICALVMDESDGRILESRSEDNVFIAPVNAWDRQQEPDRIHETVGRLISELTGKYKSILCIGISCQMHGILYVDESGRAVSPLFTWQDQCASLPMDAAQGGSYASYLKEYSPGPVAPGYGLSTFFYHYKNKLVPEGAVKICTIGDYICMRLCNSSEPLMHITNAAGMGFFDLRSARFDTGAMERAGLDPSYLPRVISGTEALGEYTVGINTVGIYADGIPVAPAIGDNQASFLGAVREPSRSVAVNIGTGSQISVVSRDCEGAGALEARPYFDGQFLLVGASLCGGRAYAILERFFRDVLKMAGLGDSRSLFNVMDAAAHGNEMTLEEPSLKVNTLFAGTRQDASIRGSILNISEDNFTPACLVTGFLHGIADELYSLYLPVRERGSEEHSILVGSGNGIRKCEPLKKILSNKFNMALELPQYEEEAAYGAALYALAAAGFSGRNG